MSNDYEAAQSVNDREPAVVPSRADPSVTSLTHSAASWIADALVAWTQDDFRKVAALAPLAVEHLGKALLWSENPVLLLPLHNDAESSLHILAGKPDLANPQLRTIGLSQVLTRSEKVLGALPLDAKQRRRLANVRNGAMHVGTSSESRNVVSDCLVVCQAFLRHLGESAASFYGFHSTLVTSLLDQSRTEAGHRVTAKMANARRRLTELEDGLGAARFQDLGLELEREAEWDLNPDDWGVGLLGVWHTCPECGSRGRLFGAVDVEPDVDFDYEQDGNGASVAVPYIAGWFITMVPSAFECNVCKLAVGGPAELPESGLPAVRINIDDATDISDDFDPAAYADA